MTSTCETCQFWKRGTYQHGECSALHESGQISPDLICDGDYEPDVIGFETREDFGCVLHEPREVEK